jgi:hypothetical protein
MTGRVNAAQPRETTGVATRLGESIARKPSPRGEHYTSTPERGW